MENLFAAVDISVLSTNVETVMIAFVGVGLLFVGYRYVKKLMGRG